MSKRRLDAYQVVSDSKLNVEHDFNINFDQKLWEMPYFWLFEPE